MNVFIYMETKKVMLKRAVTVEEFPSITNTIYRIRSDWYRKTNMA